MKNIFNYKKIIVLFIILLSCIIWCNYKVVQLSSPYITDDVNKVIPKQTGLLLGTSRLLKNGRKNDFFYHRIEAAVLLYKTGKIKYIIVSGDNSSKEYNEPLDMKNELIKAGIPVHRIFLDYAGFRTLDSVIRADKIFGQKEFIVISQKFHNERAVFIARNNYIKAYGFNAKEVKAYRGFKTKIREYFARVKVYIDFAFNVQPKYLGDKIILPS